MTSKKENIRWNVVHKLTPPITTKQTLNAKQLEYKKERKNGEVSNASKPSNMATSLLFAHSRALQANKLSIFPNFLAPFSIVSQLPPAVKFARKSQGWWKNLYESNLFFYISKLHIVLRNSHRKKKIFTNWTLIFFTVSNRAWTFSYAYGKIFTNHSLSPRKIIKWNTKPTKHPRKKEKKSSRIESIFSKLQIMLHYSPIRRVVDRLQKGQIIAEIITNFSLSSIIWRVKGLTDYRSGRGRREGGQEGREERRKG